MRLDIRYRMSFAYDAPVREEHNEIRVRPAETEGQRLIAYRLTPMPIVRVLSFIDYWGTTVEHVNFLAEHDQFEIIADAAVETRPPEPVLSAPIAHLDDDRFKRTSTEFLEPSPHVRWDDNITQTGRHSIAGATDVLSAVDAVVGEVRNVLSYEKGSTEIGVALDDLMVGRAGVCQDFTHLTIGMLRAVGIPARYVSGYLFAADETRSEEIRSESVTVQTHAWVEAAVPGQGWVAVDPTNDRPVSDHHVVIGHGRDYDDVAPVRGIYLGEATPTVEANVEIRRMEPLDHATRSQGSRRPGPPSLLDLPPIDQSFAQQQQQQ